MWELTKDGWKSLVGSSSPSTSPIKEVFTCGEGDLRSAPMFNILVVDAQGWRTNSFRVKGNGKPHRLQIVSTLGELQEALEKPEPIWDVLIFSCSLGSYNNPLLGATEVVKAFSLGKVKGVVCNATLHDEGVRFCRFLDKLKVPVIYIPYKYDKPGARVVVPFRE